MLAAAPDPGWRRVGKSAAAAGERDDQARASALSARRDRLFADLTISRISIVPARSTLSGSRCAVASWWPRSSASTPSSTRRRARSGRAAPDRRARGMDFTSLTFTDVSRHFGRRRALNRVSFALPRRRNHRAARAEWRREVHAPRHYRDAARAIRPGRFLRRSHGQRFAARTPRAHRPARPRPLPLSGALRRGEPAFLRSDLSAAGRRAAESESP